MVGGGGGGGGGHRPHMNEGSEIMLATLLTMLFFMCSGGYHRLFALEVTSAMSLWKLFQDREGNRKSQHVV